MILAYLALLNLAGFLAMGWDKSRAQAAARRVPERTLLTLAALGGAIGVVAGQQAFRHKTRKQPFGGWLLAILILQLAATGFALVVPAAD